MVGKAGGYAAPLKIIIVSICMINLTAMRNRALVYKSKEGDFFSPPAYFEKGI